MKIPTKTFALICLAASSAVGTLHAEKKKILFLAGGPSHASGEHEFRAGCMILADALNKSGLDIEAKVHSYGWPKDESIFDDVDACIVYADGGGRFGQKYAFLDKKVKQDGMGIMFMHYGVHPSKPVGEKYFKNWIGAYMETGWSVNPHWVADMTAVAKEEVANGLKKPIKAYDEFYFNMRYPGKDEINNTRSLAVATPTPDKIVRYINLWNKHGENCFGKEQALMWCNEPKKGGRGVGFVGGHYHKNWAIDDFRMLVLNSIVWVAKGKVPKDGVKSAKVTKEMLNANLDRKRKINVIELPSDKELNQKPMVQPWFDEKGKRHRSKPKQIKANDKPRIIAKSEKLTAKAGGKSVATIEANIEGYDVISISSDPLGANSHDWLSLVELYFIDKAGNKTAIEQKHIFQSSTGWGKLGVNKNCEGGKISLAGKVYAKGFGMHAPSKLMLAVPRGAVKISLIGGIDDAQKNTVATLQLLLTNPGAKWAPEKAAEKVAVSHFSTPSDKELEVTLWAQSPMLYNPTNMDIDHKGRIWVAEGVNYRRQKGRRALGDRIVVLQDTNGDGKADKSHTFVQEKDLECPLGVAVFDNKVIVPSPPNLIVYTDVNRDLKFDPKVDKREVLLTGFNARQHDHSLHSLTAGPDGKWYFNNGNCGAIFTDKSGKTFNMNGVYRGGGGTYYTPNNKLGGKKSSDGFLWTAGFGVRMNPDGTNAEIFGHGYRNSYEQSVNSFGDIFQNDNDDYQSCRNSYVLEYGSAGFFSRDGQRPWQAERRPGQPIPLAHWRQADPGTFDAGDVYGLGSPTGNVFYENGALGKNWEGSYLASEAARNTIFGYKPKAKGASFEMKRFDFLTTNLDKKFIGGDFSKKIGSLEQAEDKGVLFRPSDVAVGPDGAIYVTDWYDGRVGGHATIDNTCSGAIYRIAPKGFKPQIPAMDLKTTKGQITALSSPAINVRHLGFRALRDGKGASYDAVAALLNHPNKYVASRAIWLLPHLGEKGMAKCAELLKSKNADTRMVTLRAIRRAGKNVLPYAKQLANDPNTAVRRDVALALRHFSAKETASIFVELAKGYDGKDKNYLEAIGLGAENKEDAVWKALKAAYVSGDSDSWSDNFAKLTWRLWPVSAVADLKARAVSKSLTQAQREFAVESLAFINDKSAAIAMLDVAGKTSPVDAKAAYWLLKRGTGVWSKFGIRGELKKRGIYDPSKIVVNSITVPKPNAKSNLPSVDEIAALKGDPVKGKATMMRCTMCHNIDGVGANYGPALKGWGSTQSKKAIITSILEPSAGIAHGFKGMEITLKDGKIVHGLVIPGNPLIVKSTGGVTQMIPKSQVKSKKYMNRSLMLSAEQLGLTAQDIADVTAFMKTWK